LLFGVVNRATLLWSEITELGKTWQVTTKCGVTVKVVSQSRWCHSQGGVTVKRHVMIKRSSQVGIWLRDSVIVVSGAIWNAADQSKAYGTALVSRLCQKRHGYKSNAPSWQRITEQSFVCANGALLSNAPFAQRNDCSVMLCS